MKVWWNGLSRYNRRDIESCATGCFTFTFSISMIGATLIVLESAWPLGKILAGLYIAGLVICLTILFFGNSVKNMWRQWQQFKSSDEYIVPNDRHGKCKIVDVLRNDAPEFSFDFGRDDSLECGYYEQHEEIEDDDKPTQ